MHNTKVAPKHTVIQVGDRSALPLVGFRITWKSMFSHGLLKVLEGREDHCFSVYFNTPKIYIQ